MKSALRNLLNKKYSKPEIIKPKEIKTMPAYKMQELKEKKNEAKDKSELSITERLMNIKKTQGLCRQDWGTKKVEPFNDGTKDFIPMNYDENGIGISSDTEIAKKNSEEEVEIAKKKPAIETNKLNFTNLVHHDEYSVKHAIGRPEEIISILKERKQTHYAVCNYNETSGWINQFFTCKKNDIVPILGIKFVVNNYSTTLDGKQIISVNYKGFDEEWTKPLEKLTDDEKCLINIKYNIILYATSVEGFFTIIRLHNYMQLKNIGNACPTIDEQELKKYGKDVLCILNTPLSEVGGYIFNEMFEKAYDKYNKYKSVFNEVYVDLPIMDEQDYVEINNNVIKFSQKYNVPTIISCNSHYINKEDEDTYNILKIIQKNKRNITNYDIDTCNGMYYRSLDDMKEVYERLYKSEIFTDEVWNDGLQNVHNILSDIQTLELDTSPKMPSIENAQAIMREKAFEGLKNLKLANKQNYIDRLEYELDNVIRAGFSDYFLFLEDVCNWCHNNGVLIGPGRGCFTPFMRVLMGDGFYKFIADVKKGDIVISGDGNKREVLELFEYDINEEIIDIELDDGRIISCTLEHKIKVLRNNKEEWIEAQNLVEGDDIVEINL